jgi:hypothetical protein
MVDVYVYDGRRYQTVYKSAEAGNRVIINDRVYTAVSSYMDGIYYYEGVIKRYCAHGKYHVLESLEPEVTDLIANLARRVSSLEQQLSATQTNVEKLAEELANTKHRVSKHANMFGIVEERVGMLTDDIITLDERSQVLNAINKFYEEGSR